MIKSNSLTALLVFATAATVNAAAPVRRAIVFGGNCDEAKATNMFHEKIENVTALLTKRQWDVVPLFDGDRSRCTTPMADPLCQHSLLTPPAFCCPTGYDQASWDPNSIAKAANRAPDSVPRGSKEELLKALDQAKDLPPGSQLLLMINTHGGPALNGTAHTICLSDDKLMSVDDPDFTSRLEDLTKNRKIRLAVTDESCFGGGSIEPLSQYGCVVSSQTENRVSYGTPLSDALKDLTSESRAAPLLNGTAPTMEDVFLHALLDQRAVSEINPQISGYNETRDLSEEASSNVDAQFNVLQPLHGRYDAQHSCAMSVQTTLDDFSANIDTVLKNLRSNTDPYRNRLEKFLPPGTDLEKALNPETPEGRDLAKIRAAIAANAEKVTKAESKIGLENFDVDLSLRDLPAGAAEIFKKAYSTPLAAQMGMSVDSGTVRFDPQRPGQVSVRVSVYFPATDGKSFSIDSRAKQLADMTISFIWKGMPLSNEQMAFQQILAVSFKKALAPMYQKYADDYAQINTAVQESENLNAQYRTATQNAHRSIAYSRALDYLRRRDDVSNSAEKAKLDACRSFSF